MDLVKTDLETNIVLIGMPGAGKSTLGVLLAKELSRSFMDTEGHPLQAIIEENGVEHFLAIEESHILSLRCEGYVIATGGSVVYSPKTMTHLKTRGVVVLLELSLPLLIRRIRDMDSRGIAMAPGQDLASLYHERKPLYDRYADIRISSDHKGHEQVLREILSRLASYSPA
jgi:shikimate kinase